jgi:hypothetical protein
MAAIKLCRMLLLITRLAERSRSLSGLLLSGLPDRQAMVSKTYGAVVSKASEVLERAGSLGGGLSSLGSSLARRRSPPPAPPPVLVPVRLLEDGEVLLRLPFDASLQQLQQECFRQAGVPLHLQRLCIEGGPACRAFVWLLRGLQKNVGCASARAVRWAPLCHLHCNQCCALPLAKRTHHGCNLWPSCWLLGCLCAMSPLNCVPVAQNGQERLGWSICCAAQRGT